MASPAYDQVQVLDTRVCVVCDRLIDSQSNTCPHCQAAQPSLRATRSATAPIVLISVISICVLAFVYVVPTGSPTDVREVQGNLPGTVPDIDHASEVPIIQIPTTAPESDVHSEIVDTAIESILRNSRTLGMCDQYIGILSMCQESLFTMEQHPALGRLAETDPAAYCVTVREVLLNLVGTSDPPIARIFNRLYEASGSCRETR